MCKKILLNIRSLDYRFYILFVISVVFLVCGFQFPNSLPRLGESIRDLFHSFVFYFFEIVNPGSSPFQVTVNSMPSWQWAEDPFPALIILPENFDAFLVLWNRYWKVFATWECFEGYISFIGDLLFVLSRIFVILLPFFLVIKMLLNKYTDREPSKRNYRSRPLRAFEFFLFKAIYPVVSWIKDFVSFSFENKKILQFWLFLWLLYFNVFSILVSFLAWYFSFIVNFDFSSIFIQFVKLFRDLTPVIRFIPGVVWIAVCIWVYNRICTSFAFARLYHYEKCNRQFLESCGVVTTVYGPMGVGKTQLLTSMALSSEVKQFDDAFEIMLESDLKFPNFPWQRLRSEIKNCLDSKKIVDLSQAKKWVLKARKYFDYISSRYTPGEWREKLSAIRKAGNSMPDYTFGYDYEHYTYFYNDNLKVSHLFDAILDYTQAYIIFTVKTTVLFSNYSIRLDSIIDDLGNLPLRDNDFFKRDSRLQESYSRHAHIIDFDMLRLGKKMIADNEKARRLSFGVYVITEIDKERKNTLELQEVKRKTEEINQKNDLFNACLMMSRHSAVVANRVFIRIICDLQRPEAWGAGGRELGDVVYIKDKGDMCPVLPFFSPYWFCQLIYQWLKEKRDDFHSEYEHIRRDGTLLHFLFENFVHLLKLHYDKVEGLFNKQNLNLEIQSGRLDGEVQKAKWRILTKKDRSNRYKTDCLETVFESYKPNMMHVDDFLSYSSSVGTLDENSLQHSFFQSDIIEFKKQQK